MKYINLKLPSLYKITMVDIQNFDQHELKHNYDLKKNSVK